MPDAGFDPLTLQQMVASEALLALVDRAAMDIDQAQVTSSAAVVGTARLTSLKAALFAAHLDGDAALFCRSGEDLQALLRRQVSPSAH